MHYPRTLCHFLLFVAVFGTESSQGIPSSPCCAALSVTLGSKVVYPASVQYIDSSTSYFSAFENELKPSCVVTPQTANDVSQIVKTLRGLSKVSRCKAAVRGGGHTAFAGSANIDGGVTIDMRQISGVNVSDDRTVTKVGAGERWGTVYTKLDALGLSVSGGRVSKPGVAGLTTGGGISFFSTRKGFVCDNVVNYEIVLASGNIVNANARENRDLWLALKGGSNNFGIVTRFDLITFEQGKLWGGSIFFDPATFPQHIKAVTDLTTDPKYDEYAHVIVSYGFGQGAFVAANNLYYTKASANPPSLQPFTSIKPQLFNNLRISNLTDFTDEQGAFSTDGLRQTYMTTTVKPTVPFLTSVWSQWNTSLSTVRDGTSSLLGYSLVFQPIPPAMTSKSAPLGGNSLGIDPSDGPLMLVLLASIWSSTDDDAKILGAQKDFLKTVDAEAEQQGLGSSFRYLNYAYKDENPIQGYGKDVNHKLNLASKKYDPEGFFQTVVPGGFKLSFSS